MLFVIDVDPYQFGAGKNITSKKRERGSNIIYFMISSGEEEEGTEIKISKMKVVTLYTPVKLTIYLL